VDDDSSPTLLGCLVIATLVVWSFLAGMVVSWWI